MPSEPVYHDEPLSVWLTRASENGVDPFSDKNPKNNECREAIRSIGTNAIPPLLRMLQAKDSALKRKAMELEANQTYVNMHFHSAEDEKEKGEAGFLLLGDLATNAIPALIEISQHPATASSKEAADRILMSLYPAKSVVVPYWVPAGNRAEWYVNAGRLQFGRGSGPTSNAILAYSQAIELAPTNFTAWLMRGHARLELEDFARAQSDFDKALELSPANVSAVSGRASCKFASKDFRGAEADFTVAINLDTNDFSALYYRGVARANLRQFDAAMVDFDRAIELAPTPVFYRSRAGVETMQGEYESALEDISKCLDLDGKDPANWVLRARVQNVLRNYGAALTDVERALQLDPKDTNANAHACRAAIYLSMDQFDKSAADLEAALKSNSNNVTVFLLRGFLKGKQGAEDSAILADLERAVELGAKAPETHSVLGAFQYRAHQWQPALTNFRGGLELGALPYRTGNHAYIWLIRAQSGEQEAANQELQTFLKSLDDARTNEWSAITARFLTGDIPETNYFRLAITAAKRPSAVTNQIADSFFYAAMKRKIAGDKSGAIELLQKCLDTKEDNSFSWMNAGPELRALKAQ